MQETYANKVYSAVVAGRMMSAIQITTATSAVLDMLAKGELPTKGFIRQEEIGLDAFLKSRFGHHYEQRAYADKMAG